MYKKSTPRIEAEIKLLILKNAVKLLNKSIDRKIVQLALQAGIFNLTPTMEVYLSDIFDLWIRKICINKRSYSDISLRVRVDSLINELDALLDRNRHKDRIHEASVSLIKRKQIFELLQDDSEAKSQVIRGVHVYRTNKYPSVENLNKIGKRLGISLMNELNKTCKLDMEIKLKSILDVREEIAHSAPPVLAKRDVIDRIENCKDFIVALDRVFYKTLCGSELSFNWPVPVAVSTQTQI